MLVDLLRVNVLQVAGEHDQVGALGVDTVDGLFEYPLSPLGVGAHMGVGEQHQSVTVKGLRQVRRDEHGAVDLQLPETDEAAVDDHIPDERHAERTDQIADVDTPMQQLTES